MMYSMNKLWEFVFNIMAVHIKLQTFPIHVNIITVDVENKINENSSNQIKVFWCHENTQFSLIIINWGIILVF